MRPVRQESSSPLEFLKLSAGWEGPLADFFQALREAGDEPNFHPHPLDAESARKLTSYTGHDLYYIAAAGGRVLGYGMLRGWDEGHEVPSLGIALHPQARGKGLGKALMCFLHAAARQKGANRIRLKVYPQNATAVNLYRSLGYKFETMEGDQSVGYLDLAHG
jgi:ribosomal protein S18 acetylase RimI-like enzyme